MRLFVWLAFGEWRAQPVRNALSVAAIAVGVALGFAVHLVNAVALDRFTGGLNRLRGAADLQVRGTTREGFDENLYARIAGPDSPVARDLAVASPIVEREVSLVDAPAITLQVTGLDVLRAASVTPSLIGRPVEDSAVRSLDWLAPDAISVGQDLLDVLHRRIGDPLAVSVAGRTVVLKIAGRLPDDEGADSGGPSPASPVEARRTFRASMDIAGAQWKLDRLGRLSRIDLRLREGADAMRVRAALAKLLPADAQLTSADDDRARTGDLSRAYRVNLDMLALMALFTGAFLVFSTQTLAVARRRSQLALLRVVGVVRRRVIVQVLAEGAGQGVIGGLIGLALGIAIAAAALRYFGGDLGGGYFSRGSFDLHRLVFAAPEAAALFFGLGLVAALVGSFIPARAAAREAPALALKSSGSDVGSGRASPWIAATLIAAGIVAALLPPIAGLPIAGYVGMALLLFGGIAAMPWVARRVLSPFVAIKRRLPVGIDLALRRLWAAPSAAAVALCGIVASASLMVAMTVMIASFRHSVDAWLVQLLAADVYLRVDPGDDGGAGLSADDIDRLRQVDGVTRVDVQKTLPLALAATRPPVSLIVRSLDVDDPTRSLPLVDRIDPVPGDDAIPVWVSEAMVDLYGDRPGRSITLPIGDRPDETRYRVEGVWRDYARQFGSIVMRREDYTRVTHDARFTDVGVMKKPDAKASILIDSLRAALPERLRARALFAEPSTIRKISLDIFDRSFAVTYLLQGVAIAIGLAGVATTFSAQTLARAREFGMLRHIGVLRRQIIGELAAEGALLGLLGAVSGAALGIAMSQVLIHVVNPQSFHWTMDTEVPWTILGAVGVALVVASAGTAMVSGRRAMSHDAVMAVREDW